MIGAQQPRCGRVAKTIALTLEHTVRREQTQDTTQRIRVGSDRRRQLLSRAGRVGQRIRDAQISNDMETPGEAVAAGDL